MNSQPALAALAAAALPSLALAQVGTNYCGPAVPNSTGQSASISAFGSADFALNSNRLTLIAEAVPSFQFGFFFTGRTPDLVPNPGGSAGNLCLGGTIGRYDAPSQILNAGIGGRFELSVDLGLTPAGSSFVPVLAGETWNYQAWFRDFGPGGVSVSNFSDALQVQFFDSCPSCTALPVMVPIPAGVYWRGSNAGSGHPYYNNTGSQPAQPVHQVTISYDFWMGQYEVTQAEYEAVMGVNPSLYQGPTRPVEEVSWFDACDYCEALTTLYAATVPPGYEFRLPTEGEWEYACRAGSGSEFHYGGELFCGQARILASLHSNAVCAPEANGGHAPVGSYAPNAFGLYDMHGNVLEWCLDSPSLYQPGPVTDPFFTGNSRRMIRGGGWRSDSRHARSALRFDFIPGNFRDTIGFRVVLAPILVP